MKIKMLYGKKGIDIDILSQNVYKIIRKKKMPLIEKPGEKIKESLNNPIGTPPLSEIAKGKKDAVIVVSDITRPVPNKIILPPLIAMLRASGISKNSITILIATGMHRPNIGDELVELLGKDITKNYKIVNHDGMRKENMGYVGNVSNGTNIYINNLFLKADLKILTGLIEPHFMAGFSGGRKSVLPGISSIETIKYYHSPQVLESPYARNLVLANNPFHIGATEISKKVGVDFILNVVIDEDRNIGGIFAGDLQEAYDKGVNFAKKYSKVKIKEPVDAVITTSAGYPLDKTYYQTVKGLVGVLDIIKDNGIVVVLSECSEGLGSKYFKNTLLKLKEMGNYDKFITYISNMDNFRPDQWEVEELVKVLKKVKKIYMFSSLSDSDYNYTYTEKINSPEEGIKKIKKELGDNVKIALIPEGPYVIPQVN